jgi:hypothetical protein
MDIGWVAWLSNDAVIHEHHGNFKIIEGEPSPWVRLCSFLVDNNLHIVKLALDVDGELVHLPSTPGFGLDEFHQTPRSYSIQYRIEGEVITGEIRAKGYIDLAGHYEDFTVHLIHDMSELNAWILVTKGDIPLMESPRSEH